MPRTSRLPWVYATDRPSLRLALLWPVAALHQRGAAYELLACEVQVPDIVAVEQVATHLQRAHGTVGQTHKCMAVEVAEVPGRRSKFLQLVGADIVTRLGADRVVPPVTSKATCSPWLFRCVLSSSP